MSEYFPHLSLTIPEWGILVVVVAIAIYYARQPYNRLTEIVDQLKPEKIGSLVARASEDVLRRRSPTIEELTSNVTKLFGEMARLRQTLADGRWFLVAIQVPGYKPPGTSDSDSRPVYAPVLLNWQTGEVRAPGSQQRFMTEAIDRMYQYAGEPVPYSCLCAPRYQRVADDPKTIILLGETYQYR